MFFCMCCVFVFFKQKTAYVMRISDWSSDVCSSDLENFRIRWTENAEHTPPMMVPAQPNRSAANWLITFQGIIEQSLQDLIDWVEEGKVPAGTNFAFSDGKINLPTTAAERGGIQPVVSVTAGGSARLEAKVGEMVEQIGRAHV